MYGYIEKSGRVISQQDINELKKFGLNLESAAQPPDGMVYLYVFFEIKNNSATEYKLDLMFDQNHSSVDGAKLSYSLDASMAGAYAIDNTTGISCVDSAKVEPGQSAIVYFPYEAPSGWQEAEIRLKYDKTYSFILKRADVLTEDQAKSLKSGSTSTTSTTDTAVNDTPSNSDSKSKKSGEITTSLSPNIKCPTQPTIYCSPRGKNLSNDKAYDTKSISVTQINNDAGKRSYGLYFKFTPAAKDDGYLITRIDVVISDAKNKVLFVDGFDTFIRCQKGYYWAWNFFSLDGLYDNMKETDGQIVVGQYRMDIYFNELWAGKTSFRIVK